MRANACHAVHHHKDVALSISVEVSESDGCNIMYVPQVASEGWQPKHDFVLSYEGKVNLCSALVFDKNDCKEVVSVPRQVEFQRVFAKNTPFAFPKVL